MRLFGLKVQLSVYVSFLIAILLTFISWNVNWTGNKWNGIIKSDGKGYYAYLPAVFIYNDLNFGFFEEIEKEKYFDELIYYDYRSTFDDVKINKYYCGTSLAQLPFFIIAHSLSCRVGSDVDGYSKPYQILINVAAIFYMLAGLLFLNLLLGFYGIKEWQKSLILISTVFGTNLFYYVMAEPSMSHVYSFAFVSAFMYYSKALFETQKSKYIFLIAFTLGVIVLIRPVNLIVVLIWPFLAGSLSNLIQAVLRLFRKKIFFVSGLLLFLLIVSIQFIIYKISTGSFFVYSYQDESFNFLNPAISDILFSYKKGLFIYTPLYFLSFLGCYYLYKKSFFSCISYLLFFIILTYIFSSWWMWYYGGSFSSRVYIEFIPAFMLMLAFALQGVNNSKTKKYVLVSLIIALILACQIQTYQYRYYRIHWSDMTKEMYWNEFLRIDHLIEEHKK